MAYEQYVKQTFVDYPDAEATVLKKEHMDHIEAGIVALESHTLDVESDVILIKQSGAPSVSAARFEAGENENISALDPRGGVEITIMTTEFKEDGTTEVTYDSKYVFDGYDGATVPGLSIYPFDPGSNNVSGALPFSTVTIPDGRTLQVNDFLLTTDGEIYKVTLVYADYSGFKVELFTTLEAADGADGKSAYAYAVEGGYTGTEAEFAAKLAAELPVEGTEGQILTKTAEGVAWGDAPSGTFVVTVTDHSSGEYTADKGFYEIQAAVDDGMEVVLSAGGGRYLYKLTDAAGSYFEFASTYKNAAHSLMIFTDDYVQYTETALGAELPEDGTPGQYLSLDAGGIPVWADLPEQETELPTGGTEGQVLTIGSDGSPVWADPTTLTSVYEGVF